MKFTIDRLHYVKITVSGFHSKRTINLGRRHKKFWRLSVRGVADKSLVRPGRKKATATQLGIYSTYSPWSSLRFLSRCSNSCKSLQKIQKFVRTTRSPRQQWPPRRTKNGKLSIVFSVQGIGDSPTEPDPGNRVGDQDIGSPGRPFSSGLQVRGELGNCRARTRPPGLNMILSRNMSPHLWLTMKLVVFWLNQLSENLVKIYRDDSNKKSLGWLLFYVVQDEAYHRWKYQHI